MGRFYAKEWVNTARWVNKIRNLRGTALIFLIPYSTKLLAASMPQEEKAYLQITRVMVKKRPGLLIGKRPPNGFTAMRCRNRTVIFKLHKRGNLFPRDCIIHD